jgi:hypothetical protein
LTSHQRVRLQGVTQTDRGGKGAGLTKVIKKKKIFNVTLIRRDGRRKTDFMRAGDEGIRT